MRENLQNVSRKIDIITFYNLKIKTCLKATKKYYKTNEQKSVSKLTIINQSCDEKRVVDVVHVGQAQGTEK